MATLQPINLGNQVNDGLGDDLRSAFQKVNANFASLNTELGIRLTAINAAGTAGQGIVADGLGPEISFRNLIPGDKIILEGFADSIRINSTQADAFTRITTNSGNSISAEEYDQITIQGGKNVNVSDVGQVITVDTNLDLDYLFSSYDFGPISGNFANILQFALASSNIDFGTVTNPGYFNIDFGTI
jgi:hypothetical protein